MIRRHSLIAPWVQWGIEKKRIKQKRRIELLREWRRIISKPNSCYYFVYNIHKMITSHCLTINAQSF